MASYKKLTFVLILFFPVLSHAQQTTEVPDNIVQAVANDIWIPFMEAYRDYDAEKIKAIHSPDIIRVSEKGGTIDKGQPYIDAFGGALVRWEEEGRIMRISFSIISTSFGSDLVSQRGYYKISAQEPGDEKIIPRGFSEFSVIMRQEDGKWRFILDSDRRVDITEEDFQATGLVYDLENN